MGFFSVAEERPRITIVWRDGRWVPVLRRSHRTLRLIAEGVAMSALSCAIVALGGVAGFYTSRRSTVGDEG
jgi:hypothetical protein